MNREKLNAAIFEAARHTGITADQAERFVGTLEICGISLSALDAPPAPAKDGLCVRFAEMTESNGRVTWFVSLAHSEDAAPMDCHQIYGSTIKGRAEYERDALLHFLGKGPRPDILAYETEPPKE